MTAEDDRAAEYRRKMEARARNKRTVEKSLAGSASAKAALVAATEPLLFVDDDGVPRNDAFLR